MKVEDVTVSSVSTLSVGELKDLVHRASQLFSATEAWRQSIAAGRVGVVKNAGRADVLQAYGILTAELRGRGQIWPEGELDRKVARKRLRGLDVPELPVIPVRENVVALAGAFVAGPRTAKGVDVRVDSDELGDEITYEIERRVAELVSRETGLPLVLRRDAEGLAGPVLPLYDLVLVPKAGTADLGEDAFGVLAKRLKGRQDTPGSSRTDERGRGRDNPAPEGKGGPGGEQDGLALSFAKVGVDTDLSKPFPFEHAARQLDPGQFDDFRRQNNKFAPGIHAIWGIKDGKTKLQSIRFAADKFTPEQAKKWLEEHKMRTEVEEATSVKKSSDAPFIKSSSERIVGGVVYSLGSAATADGQGDFVDDPAEIWNALKDWTIRSKGQMKIMHKGEPVPVTVVENMMFDEDTIKGGKRVRKGDWYVSCFIPPGHEDLWQAIQDGDINGFSLAGSGKAEKVGPD